MQLRSYSENGLGTGTASYLNGNSGVAQKNWGLSWRGLIAATIYSIAASMCQIAVFLVLRGRLPKVYQPRTFLVPYWKQVDAPRKGTLQWLYPVWSTPDSEILEKCGLDAYCFMRYLNLLLRIFCPLALVVMPLLLPINITSDDQQPQSGLDILSIANVAPRYTATRLWIHCVMSLSTIAWICYQFYYEFHSYVRIKQKSFSSAASHSRASCTTILVRDLPAGYDERETLERLFGCFPGGVKNVWINRNHDHIAALVEYQTKTRDLLEEHETILIKSCQAKNLPCLAEENTTPRAQASSSAPQTNTVLPRWQRRFRRLSRVYQADIPNLRLVYPRWVPRLFRYDELKAFLDAHPEADAAWRKFMKPSERASLRLPLLRTTWWPSLPGLGHKVDRIYYLRYTLAELNSRIDRLKSRSEHSRSLRCAFVQFNRQIAAHMACQSVTHHSPHTMAPRIIGVGPSDVLWENLSLSWWQRIFRNILAVFLGALVILLFAVPVTFTSLLNNLDLLASRVTWLSWLTALPLPLKSVLQGLLPPLLLQILLLLIPPTYRYVAEFQGAATAGARELSVQSWYFVFLFTQLFVVVTVSGGVVRLATRVADDPKSVGALLAFAVPRAANYFFGHLIMRGLSGSAGTLLQLEALTHALMSKLNAKSTPREEFRRQVKLANIQWGSFWPPFTNLAVIGIILTPVAPLVLIFVLLVFGLFWATFRYSILFVLEFEQETGGLLLPAAINQTFTGLYVMQICVAGIFFMSRDSTGRASCLWQGSFILVGLICTAVFQVWLNYTFRPLLYFAPMTSDVTMPDPARQEGCVLARETDSTRPPPSAPRDCKSASDDDVEIRATETFTYHKNRIRDLLDLSAYEREEVLKRAFLHPAARAEKVTVWIPQDVNCIGADELKHGTEAGLSYSDVGCKINRKGELIVEKLPPDFSSLDAMRL